MAQQQPTGLPDVFAAFEERVADLVEARVIARLTEGFGLALISYTHAKGAGNGKRGLPRASSRVFVTDRDPLNKRGPDLIEELLSERTGKNPKFPALVKKAVAKRKPQLCPVPKCKERAAPVYGMVCAKHKDVPKAKIAKYRMQRRAAAKK